MAKKAYQLWIVPIGIETEFIDLIDSNENGLWIVPIGIET